MLLAPNFPWQVAVKCRCIRAAKFLTAAAERAFDAMTDLGDLSTDPAGRVKEADRPATNQSRQEDEPSMLQFTSMTPLACVTLALALALGGQPSKKPSGSVRVGDYLVTITRVYASSESLPRYHRVIVEVTVENVSRRIPRTHILFPRLKVKPYYEYDWDAFSRSNIKAPDLNQMLPGEKRTGGYTFDARNGTTPVALEFEPGWNPVTRTVQIALAGLAKAESPR